MYDYITNVLRNAGIELAHVALVGTLILLGLIVPLCAAMYLMFKRAAAQRGININFRISQETRPADSMEGETYQMPSAPQDAVQSRE